MKTKNIKIRFSQYREIQLKKSMVTKKVYYFFHKHDRNNNSIMDQYQFGSFGSEIDDTNLCQH